MADRELLFSITLAVIMLGVTGMVGLAILENTADTTAGSFSSERDDAVLLDGTQWTTVGDYTGTSETVYDSRGYALAFDSTDSVNAPVPDTFPTDSWGVCTAARLNASAQTNRTYTVFASENSSIALYYDHENWRVHYDNGSANESVALGAPAASAGFTNLCTRYNATSNELVLRRNSTQSSPVSLDTSRDLRNVSYGWEGRLDELRVFNDTLSNATMQSYTGDPLLPQPNGDRILRVMFDEGSGTTTDAYFVEGGFSIDGTEWGAGIPGNALSEGTDYQWRTNGPQLRAVSGGRIDGAPVAFAVYDASTVHADWTDSLVNAFNSLETLIAVLSLVLILSYLQLLRGR